MPSRSFYSSNQTSPFSGSNSISAWCTKVPKNKKKQTLMRIPFLCKTSLWPFSGPNDLFASSREMASHFQPVILELTKGYGTSLNLKVQPPWYPQTERPFNGGLPCCHIEALESSVLIFLLRSPMRFPNATYISKMGKMDGYDVFFLLGLSNQRLILSWLSSAIYFF